MTKSKIVLIIIILILGLGILGFLYYQTLEPASPKENGEEGIIPPEATGNINDLTDALEKEIIDEMNTTYEEDEANLIISDTEVIDDFGQMADDPEL